MHTHFTLFNQSLTPFEQPTLAHPHSGALCWNYKLDPRKFWIAAFLVGALIATTNRKREMKRVRELLNRLAQTTESTTASVEQASDQAISFILDLAITHPQTIGDLKVMEEGKGVLTSIIKYFFGE